MNHQTLNHENVWRKFEDALLILLLKNLFDVNFQLKLQCWIHWGYNDIEQITKWSPHILSLAKNYWYSIPDFVDCPICWDAIDWNMANSRNRFFYEIPVFLHQVEIGFDYGIFIILSKMRQVRNRSLQPARRRKKLTLQISKIWI